MFFSELISVIAYTAVILIYATFFDFRRVDINVVNKLYYAVCVTDDNGVPIRSIALNEWNFFQENLIPVIVKKSVIASEDSRFYTHNGIDWKARISAMISNLKLGTIVRGASTISEQVVKMFHKRERTFWARWMEGIEATFSLERVFPKSSILEFYINQVPYANGVRGMFDASHYFFGKSLDMLELPEVLALTVMIRSPTGLNITTHQDKLKKRVIILASRMFKSGLITSRELEYTKDYVYQLRKRDKVYKDDYSLYHFANYTRKVVGSNADATIRTTINRRIQDRVSSILLGRLEVLKMYNVHNAAALVMNRATGEIISWVSVGDRSKFIDAVLVPRLSASVMKPFLYATSFEFGASPETIVEDLPVSESVNSGLHIVQNYSKEFHTQIPIKYALANSLNIPAIQILNFVKHSNYAKFLKELEFSSINAGHEKYGNGLGTGALEISLLELVQAYSVFPNLGIFKKASVISGTADIRNGKRVFSESSMRQINSILSNKLMRVMEFGSKSVLNFPAKVAVKTGTSTDYRDSWAVGFNSEYIVGVWMGNLENTPMKGVTGSIGSAFSLRAIFFELDSNRAADGIFDDFANHKNVQLKKVLGFGSSFPQEVLQIAIDPRVPIKYQVFGFNDRRIKGAISDWFIDGKYVHTSTDGTYQWPITAGNHTLEVVSINGKQKVDIFVKGGENYTAHVY